MEVSEAATVKGQPCSSDICTAATAGHQHHGDNPVLVTKVAKGQPVTESKWALLWGVSQNTGLLGVEVTTLGVGLSSGQQSSLLYLDLPSSCHRFSFWSTPAPGTTSTCPSRDGWWRTIGTDR